MSRVDSFPDPFLKRWPVTGKIIILDLEYTSWEGSIQRNWAADWEFREIVEIGAIRLRANRQEFIVEETFERLVKPAKNSQLSDHFSDLTGITNFMVSEQGCDYEKVFAEFTHFVSNSNKIWSVGYDGEVLRENCFLNQIPYPFHKNQVLNIRPALSTILNIPEDRIVSSKLPEFIGLSTCRKRHSALSDALSIYQAINHLRTNGLL